MGPAEYLSPGLGPLIRHMTVHFHLLRDKLLALDPLDKDNVMKINKAEAEYWKKSEGYRMGWSDEILGFDCGGTQWVSRTASAQES